LQGDVRALSLSRGRLRVWRERGARIVARPFFALLVLLGRALPRPILLRLSAACSSAVYWLFPGIRAGLLSNARHILGPGSTGRERSRFARRVLSSFSAFLADMVTPPEKLPAAALLPETSGKEHFHEASERGRGIVGVTLHMGNYEVAGMEIASFRGNTAVVYNRERVRFLERLRSRKRRQKLLDEIVIEESPFFAVPVLARLREGGIVLLAADQVDAREGERFPFLHGEAVFSLWPARLSHASGAPILPAFNTLDGDGRYRLRLEKPLFPEDYSGPREMMARLVEVLAEQVARHGDQWLMIRSFWV
jgi:lauroyl/myristoyl acyltransferase